MNTGQPTTITLAGVLGGLVIVAFTVFDGVAFLVLLGLTLGVIHATSGALFTTVVIVCVLGTVGLAGGYVLALRRGRPVLAFVAVAGVVVAVLGVFASGAYPYIDRGAGLTIESAFVSPLMANFMTIATSLLLPLVLSYFVVL
ncbi:cytochrome d ubiquinol oxidase subunit II [Halocatena halophila]|uniref:cytochrome d ubiquinol oxidase subunit II n=1 Tax=Halocatena halophila TaxID=2814576 RepID=UPI002ED491FB